MRLVLLLWWSCVATLTATANELPTRTLYLVRHGFYDYVKGADEKTAMGLNTLGRAQTQFVADRLAALPVKFDALISSELTRARETGDIIAAKFGSSCDRDGLLNETTPAGVGLKPEQIDAGAEAQLQAAWARFTAPNTSGSTNEILVCHGNVIRWFVCRALDADPKQWTRMEIANCSITLIQVRGDGKVRLQMFNDIAHVPLEKQTWSGNGPNWPLPANRKK